jgi:hypothetical protein
VVKFDRIIRPGEVGFVTLSLNIPSKLGRFVKRAIVKTNDPRPPKARFSISLTGEVLADSASVESESDGTEAKDSTKKKRDNTIPAKKTQD